MISRGWLRFALLTAWIVASVQTMWGEDSSLLFEHLTKDDGLSHNSVNFIFRDSRSFMWFCTDGGLDRYDGYGFKNYHCDLGDSTTLSDDIVTGVCEDDAGGLWTGTKGGVALLDPRHETFTRIALDRKTKGSEYFNWVTAIIPCKAGGVWIGSRSGLYRVVPESIAVSWLNSTNAGRYLFRTSGLKLIHYGVFPGMILWE